MSRISWIMRALLKILQLTKNKETFKIDVSVWTVSQRVAGSLSDVAR